MATTESIQLPASSYIAGYAVLDKLYSGPRTAVYRAKSDRAQQQVVIKVLSQMYPSFGELAHFRNQYAIIQNLNVPGIVQPLALEPWQNGYALVMEDFGGVSLKQYVDEQRDQKNRLSTVEILAIALQMADILAALSQHQVIHKDIKPANILIRPASKQIQLIDFSIATRLPKETKNIQSPNVLEGSLAYLAPEQTGRMNRGIDYRTDFYGLGITLYELLTGTLPFTATEALALIHCHMTKVPVSPHEVNPEVPHMVSQIVLKLIAKNAEDRYQSALGLKHDLSQCLEALKQTGAINAFELGVKDNSDRFIVPEKLYGRDQEVKTLLQTLERSRQNTSELMLVAGYSGVGKTAIINELHKPITELRGYFIQGKFDQFNRSNPFSAFVQAFRNLIKQLLGESNQALAGWKERILRAVGGNGQVIIDVIPELTYIIGHQPSVANLSDSASQNRFNQVFRQFVRVFTQPEHPLTLFLDDLQWADNASLNLMKLLMESSSEGQLTSLLILGAYRDNEVFPGHLTLLTLDEIRQQGAPVNTLTLAPLKQPEIIELVADTLLCSEATAEPLAKHVYQKAQGNPFFTTQLLQGLHREQCITFDADAGYWQCDLTKMRQLTLTDDVVSFMVAQLRQLPQATQQVLKLAACIGNRFDLETLAIVYQCPPEQVSLDLWPSLRAGLIVPEDETYKFFQGEELEEMTHQSSVHQSSGHQLSTDNNVDESVKAAVHYRFLHDRVQQAAYVLVPDHLKACTHTTIGRLLLDNTPIEKQNERIFEITNQLNYGIRLLETDEAKEELLTLNLKAGQKAQEATAYESASDYFERCAGLLTEGMCSQQRSLYLKVHEQAAAAAFMAADFKTMEAHIHAVLDKSESVLETINVHETRIKSHVAQNQPLDAVKAAINILCELGENISLSPAETDIAQALETTHKALDGKDIAQLVDLPINENPEELAILRILMYVHPAVFFAVPQLIPIEICIRTHICLTYGNSPESAHTYADYGLLLCGVIGDIETGYAFGQLALAITEKFPLSGLQARGKIVTYFTVSHWKESLANLLMPIKQAFREAVEVGDLEFAGYGAAMYCAASYLSGNELNDLAREIGVYSQAIERTHQATCLGWCQIYHQTVLNLANDIEQPWILSGEVYDECSQLDFLYESNEFSGIFLTFVNKLTLAYLFEEYALAREYAEVAKQHMASVTAMLMQPPLFLYDSLILLEGYSASAPEENAELLKSVEENQAKLKTWGHHCPENYLHKYHLVEARKYHALGDFFHAIEQYDKAVSSAHQAQFEQEEALAFELAAKCCLDWGKPRVAAGYLQDAYYSYAHWGAKAKAEDLEKRYPELLSPILQNSEAIANPLETILAPAHSIETILAPANATNKSAHSRSAHATRSVMKFNEALDLMAVMQASQALTRTIELSDLLSQLTQIILKQSGGDFCALILADKETTLHLEATATPGHTEQVRVPVKHNPNLPVKLLNYVKNTKETVVINNLTTELPVIDRYLSENGHGSLLCLPLLSQSQLVGILYLQNHSISGVFTQDRILALTFLAAQSAISLENARLYQQSQSYAQELEHSQLQTIQAEKMASLGNLVAGVAHEINNPIGFLNGSVANAQSYLEDLLEHINLYQAAYSQPESLIEANAEEIDLAFITEDFPKLLKSMSAANERIKAISTSLRTFSRSDTEHKTSANLHEGLDSTLLILKYRLKPNEHRPAIRVVQDYGEPLVVTCFPGQLNQVFMNILANAIDVFDEAAVQSSFNELEAAKASGNPQTITVTTKLDTEQKRAEICIRDNGKGMPDQVKARIFDHLYTTKEVGKGTGLGLAIAQKIIVEAHNGQLIVDSKIGQGTEFCIRLPL